MPDLIQDVKWPGATAVESCFGTVSHGITPGTFVLVTYPQASAPRAFGDLAFSDGARAVAFRGCKVDRVTGSYGPAGQTFQLDILDRRWRWRSPLAPYGAVSGYYNRFDARGKLVPWTIRSPVELAELCLKALGETGYVIDLPRGLSRSVGRDLNRYLRLGENFPQSLANPEQYWDYTPPAEALSRLCDYFGRRVVYQFTKDRIVIARLGDGAGLLDRAPYEVATPAVTGNVPPSKVVVAGAPVRIQARFRLEAVGEEFDGSYLPINDLSYAPRGAGRVQKTTITYTGDLLGTAPAFGVRVEWTAEDGVTRAATAFVGSGNIATVFGSLAAVMAADPVFARVVSWGHFSNVFQLNGLVEGQSFAVTVFGSQGAGAEVEATSYRVDTIQTAAKSGPTWETSGPPSFVAVQATDRLSYGEALALARKSVFKCYRILNVDPATRRAPMSLPWFGRIDRRQQIILQPTKVEQVVPVPRVQDGINRGQPAPGGLLGAGILPEFYNGFSRDREATCTGSINALTGTVTWNPSGRAPNTKETDRVYVDFQVNEVEQLITFNEYVFRLGRTADAYLLCQPADLVLETGCLVRHAESDQIVRWQESLSLGGVGEPEYAIRDDLFVGVLGKYSATQALQNYTLLDAADTKARAEYYLRGLAAKYRQVGAEMRQYVGIWPIDMDGAIQQMTFSVGPEGPMTVISRNSEHSPVIPPYPARRKQENLSPDGAAAAANQAERAALQRLFPRP